MKIAPLIPNYILITFFPQISIMTIVNPVNFLSSENQDFILQKNRFTGQIRVLMFISNLIPAQFTIPVHFTQLIEIKKLIHEIASEVCIFEMDPVFFHTSAPLITYLAG